MRIDTKNNDILKRYLLDELDENERIKVEEAFFTSGDMFEDLNALEDELFYEYSGNELTQAQKTVFEAKFLRSRTDRDRAAFATAFIETAADLVVKQSPETEAVGSKGFFSAISTFFRMGSVMQAGMAAALILVAIGITVILFSRSRVENNVAENADREAEIQKRQTDELANARREQQLIDDQIASEKAQTAANEARIKELETEKDRIAKEVEAKRTAGEQKPQVSQPGGPRTVATMILSPGLFTRDDGKPMNRITLSPNAASLNLTLQLKNAGDYAKYTVNVVSVDSGASIKSASGLVPRGNGGARALNFGLPGKSVRRGDYEIELSGITKTGETERVTRYYFSVDR